MTLNNLGPRLLNVDRAADAILPLTAASASTAASLLTIPAFRVDLAWGLSTLAWAYAAERSDNAAQSAALAAAHESIDVFEELDEPIPATFTDGRHEALGEMIKLLTQHGSSDAAEQIRSRLPTP